MPAGVTAPRALRQRRGSGSTVGVARSMPFEEYLSLPEEHFSRLKHLGVSELAYAHAIKEPTPDRLLLALGRAAHTALLEPDDFPVRYAVFTGARRQGDEWQAFKEAHAGRTILKESEYREALAIRDAVRGHPVAAKLLRNGQPEQVITWTDPATGVALKARIDLLRRDGLVDLKRTAQLEQHRFERTAFDLGYHLQAALYRRGLAVLTGRPREDLTAWLVAVEANPPHDVAVFRYHGGALTTADEELDRMLAKAAAFKKSKRHPGRYPEEVEIGLPAWAYPGELGAGGTGDTLGLTIGGAA